MKNVKEIFDENAGAGEEVISQLLAEAGVSGNNPMPAEPHNAGQTAICKGCGDEVTADADGRCPRTCGMAFSAWATK